MLNNHKKDNKMIVTSDCMNMLVHKYEHFKSSSLRTVTHVFVNDPQVGYAVFGDIMISQLKELN